MDRQTDCYIDSTLFALLYGNNIWIDRMILRKKNIVDHLSRDIQNELVRIKHDINANVEALTFSCSQIKSLLQKYDKVFLHNTVDPRDLLDLLMKIFSIPPDVSLSLNGKRQKAYFTAPCIYAHDLIVKPCSIVNVIDYFPEYHIDDKTIVKYLSAKLICFSIERNYMGTKIFTKVIIPETLSIVKQKKNKTLLLRSIVIHNGTEVEGGYYTCVVRDSADTWYLYDVRNSRLKYICTGFHDLVKWKRGYIEKNCKTLVYY